LSEGLLNGLSASYGVGNGVKWPGHEADHASPPSAEVKNAWGFTSTPPHFMAWCL